MSIDGRGARWSTEVPEKKDTKVAIVQSSYIPWKGYFDLINMREKYGLDVTVRPSFQGRTFAVYTVESK